MTCCQGFASVFISFIVCSLTVLAVGVDNFKAALVSDYKDEKLLPKQFHVLLVYQSFEVWYS